MATNGTEQHGGEELWRPSHPEQSAMWRFLQQINKKYRLQLKTYHELHRWSTENIAAFWGAVWDFVGIKASANYSQVVDEEAPMFPRPPFFKDALLNFAENLLFPAGVGDIPESSLALIAATETTREEVTWGELRQRVLACQRSLRHIGIEQNQRIAGYVGNGVNAVVAMLAATSLGAVWTAISPDSGVQMVVDRLEQIAPRVLFVDDGQVYNGKTFGVLGKVHELLDRLPSLEYCVVFNVIGEDVNDLKRKNPGQAKIMEYAEFTAMETMQRELHFEQLPPDQMLYILYSSGTTGAPKCIIHGAIGTLIQHKKEHMLHSSVQPGQRLMYFTTCTWMMWHWLISGLASGATLVLYDGSPMRYRRRNDEVQGGWESYGTNLAMPMLIDELQINHFGTSAKYLSLLEQSAVYPMQKGANDSGDPPCHLSSLQAIYNTASPLSPSTFRYVYKAFGPDINLGSITGGTDIVSLFGAASPLTPVYAGEVQVPGLGMAMRSYDSDGRDVTGSSEPGDLVCVRAFPCQPVAFWGPDGRDKYRKSYFETFTDAAGGGAGHPIWHHGDFVEFNARTGGLIMLGRSDGVLKPAGVRFGSAEIYNVLLKHFSGVVADGLCVGRKRADGDEDVCLFVTMEQGKELDAALVQDIKKKVREELSARHVPKFIDTCPDIPMTINGKKVEGAVKQIVSGSKIKTSASVANAECLDFFRDWAEKH